MQPDVKMPTQQGEPSTARGEKSLEIASSSLHGQLWISFSEAGAAPSHVTWVEILPESYLPCHRNNHISKTGW